MKTAGYLILTYVIYAVLNEFCGIGGLLGGAIAGGIVGLISWIVEKAISKKKNNNEK